MQISGWGEICVFPCRLVVIIDHLKNSDQFCSLVFTLSNLYFIGCAYSGGFNDHWVQCIGNRKWGVPFVLAALPLLVRLVQSVKRWVDSRLITHLINVSADEFVWYSLAYLAFTIGRQVWVRHYLLSRIL